MNRRNLPMYAIFFAVTWTTSACVTRPIVIPDEERDSEIPKVFPQTIERDVDILFVIDNSESMEDEQTNLLLNFDKLIDALGDPKLGPRPGMEDRCAIDENGNVIARDGCNIPNVHLGVVSTDLGLGRFADAPSGCPDPDGDDAILQNTARIANCNPPSDPFISYVDVDPEDSVPGTTNIPQGDDDPVQRLKDSFRCIAKLGIEGCGIEQPLEAAKRALSGNRNEGFIRDKALLVIVLITDEDDCSATSDELFNSEGGSANPLGPLDSFRCFENGVTCDPVPGGTRAVGSRSNCRPNESSTLLNSPSSYVEFFQGLKPAGRTLVAALSGVTEPVVVGLRNGRASLDKACLSPVLTPGAEEVDGADPAIRIKSFVDAFAGEGQFTTICTDDFGPALARLGEKIRSQLGGQCLGAAPLLANGSIACFEGIDLGGGRSCTQSCLDRVQCTVTEGFSQDDPNPRAISICPSNLFDPSITDYDGDQPCWRIIPKTAECDPSTAGTPYGLDIMRKGDPEPGTTAFLRCRSALVKWGSPEFLALEECGADEAPTP